MPIQQGMSRHWISLVALTLTLTGCAAGAGDVEQEREAAFLVELSEYPDVEASDDELLKAGYLYCRDLTAGRVQEGQILVWASQSYTEEAGVNTYALAASHAPATLCPDWYKP